jgi:hypothetical protein
MTLIACVAAARPQLPQARLLARSLWVLDPQVALFVLMLDGEVTELGGMPELFTAVTPSELDVPRYSMLAGIHALPELIEVTRPALLRHVLDRTGEPVISLDIDLVAYGGLAELVHSAGTHGIALVPRILAAVPPDHVRIPSEEVVVQGVYDRGIFAIAPCEESDHFLRCWSDRLEVDDDLRRPLRSSRFLDLAPAILDSHRVVRDPGLGVSALNLHERWISREDGLLAAGRPLRLVHFDGLDGRRRAPEDPFGGRADRRDPPDLDWERSPIGLREQLQREMITGNEVLAELIGDRERELVRQARGQGDAEYGYLRLADGTPLSRRLRRMILEAERAGAVTDSPFTAEGTVALLDWLNGPGETGGGNGVTRYWHAVHRKRSDLQTAFPDLDGPAGVAYMRWIAETGQGELATPAALMPDAAR